MPRAAKQAAPQEADLDPILRQPRSEIEGHVLPDDGTIPNNRRLPLVIYREALAVNGQSSAPERAFEALFKSNGWWGVWVNGIYDFHHYHSTAHEVLGIARGFAKVMFGGPEGVVAELRAGDAAVIPAGVSHCLIEGKDLVVVGAYPEGQDWDLCRACADDRVKALENIPWVPLPKYDPVFGLSGPILTLWSD